MTKFESIGVSMQRRSLSMLDAVRNFNNSCEMCCCRGMKIDCDRCSISAVHREVLVLYSREIVLVR